MLSVLFDCQSLVTVATFSAIVYLSLPARKIPVNSEKNLFCLFLFRNNFLLAGGRLLCFVAVFLCSNTNTNKKAFFDCSENNDMFLSPLSLLFFLLEKYFFLVSGMLRARVPNHSSSLGFFYWGPVTVHWFLTPRICYRKLRCFVFSLKTHTKKARQRSQTGGFFTVPKPSRDSFLLSSGSFSSPPPRVSESKASEM